MTDHDKKHDQTGHSSQSEESRKGQTGGMDEGSKQAPGKNTQANPDRPRQDDDEDEKGGRHGSTKHPAGGKKNGEDEEAI